MFNPNKKEMSFFDPEFYPTSKAAWDAMNVDCYDKIVLDPSAGKGDLLNFAQSSGAHRTIGIEKNDQLRLLLSSDHETIGSDWFEMKSDEISHVQMILMNPPYSNGDKHILHAWNIAPAGCEIVSQCNAETIRNNYSSSREQLSRIIRDHGDSSIVGQVYRDAERTTDVEIGIIRLFKPITSDNENFEGFYSDMEFENEVSGVIRYNEIQALVNNYTGAVRCFDRFASVGRELSSMSGQLGFGSYGGWTFQASHNNSITSKEEFARELQKSAWKMVFSKFKLNKYLTSGVMSEVNKFIESRLNYPFTMKNIFRMVEIIVGTSSSNMEKAIVEAVDNFTRHTHENRFKVEGWKTNSGHMLNMKFICQVTSMDKWDTYPRIKSYAYRVDYLIDLTKALCFLTGRNYDEIPDIGRIGHGNSSDQFYPNTYYDWGFFRFKVFKKGTGHFEFLNIEDWAKLNQAYGKAKGNPLPQEVWKGFKKRTKKQAA